MSVKFLYNTKRFWGICSLLTYLHEAACRQFGFFASARQTAQHKHVTSQWGPLVPTC